MDGLFANKMSLEFVGKGALVRMRIECKDEARGDEAIDLTAVVAGAVGMNSIEIMRAALARAAELIRLSSRA